MLEYLQLAVSGERVWFGSGDATRLTVECGVASSLQTAARPPAISLGIVIINTRILHTPAH